MRSLALLAACVALTPLAALPAMSQETSQPNHMGIPQMTNPINVPDQKLDAAASAIQHVESVRHDYDQRLTSAQPADRDRLAQEGQKAMVKAVTDQGLSVDEYNSILQVAQSDPDVRERLIERVERSGGPGANDGAAGGSDSSGQ